jgi:3-oxoacyl-[acyl-carrier protein] reductase
MADKVAIVTGAGRGIGRAVALRLAQAGYNLTLASRSEDELARVRQMARRQKVEAIAAPTDVAVPAEVQAMVDATMDAFGRIDLLANVAGAAFYREKLADLKLEELDAMLDVNIKGVVLTTQAVWPIMRQQRDGGVVVNISSLASRDPYPGYAVYGATKAAVNLLTEALARAGRKDNVRLFAVCPGYVETALMRSTFPDVPPDKCLSPAEVAEIVAWCATDAARPCAGQAIYMRK